MSKPQQYTYILEVGASEGVLDDYAAMMAFKTHRVSELANTTVKQVGFDMPYNWPEEKYDGHPLEFSTCVHKYAIAPSVDVCKLVELFASEITEQNAHTLVLVDDTWTVQSPNSQ